MELIGNLLLNIVGSVLAALLLIAITGFLSRRARWILTATLGRLLDIDVEYVFRNPEDAVSDIKREIDRAKFVDLLTGRGQDLQRGTFDDALQGTRKKVRILLPGTHQGNVRSYWVCQREGELAAIDPSFGKGMLNQQIATAASFVQQRAAGERVQLRHFDAPHLGRVLLTDRCAYLTPYRTDAPGRDSHVIKYRRGGDMYDWLARLFDQLWVQPGARSSPTDH